MTGTLLGLLIAGFIGLLVALTVIAELALPKAPTIHEYRQVHRDEDRRRRDRSAAGVAIGILAVIFLCALVYPQGPS